MTTTSSWTLPPGVHAELTRALSAELPLLDAAAQLVCAEFGGRSFTDAPVGLAAALDALAMHLDAHRYDGVPLDGDLLKSRLRVVLGATDPVGAPAPGR